MNPKLIVYLVSFAAFLGPFTQTIYTPILPEVQSHFHTSLFLVNLSISIFTVFLALMQIIYGPLTDLKGRKKVLLPGIVLYIIGSTGCAFAPSIGLFLLFRSIQAIGIAAGSVVATTVIGDLFEGKERGRAMGTFQMSVALGPVLGPIIGGFVGGKTGHIGVFLVLVATGVLIFLSNLCFLKETKPELLSNDRFQVRNMVGIVVHPIGSAVIMLGFVQYYTMYNFLVFLPDILTKSYGLTAEQKGMVFLPLTISLVIGSFLGGRLQERIEARKSLVLTSSLNVLAVLLFLFLANLSLVALALSLVLFGLFLGLSLPVQTTLLTIPFVKERATAIGAYNFFRYLGMAAGPMIGSFLYHLGGMRILFSFVALLFAGAVWFARRQLLHKPIAPSRSQP
ncbi:MFS transporter [Laceyella putida]|uniref:MFS transporter n=1 Tax=Laceyella putida TaxID=110101 RepID=A0ABW2RKE5_9BACL